LNTSIEQEGQIMVDFQLPLPGLSRDFNELTKQEKDFIAYFSAIDMDSISPVVDCYAGIGPKGYSVFLILARIIKIKERILSDRQLANVLRKNDLYRFVTNDIQPAHNTFNTLRKRLGPEGFVEIHKRFVLKAHSLGLLEPEIPDLPKHRKKGIILVADSTFLITCGSTKGVKDGQGRWRFKDESVAFGKGHHAHKYPVGHKAHSVRTVSGVPMATITTPASVYDQKAILPLLDELKGRYPDLPFAYILLDRGYDAEEIHQDIYEQFDIIPIIIRKKMVYPEGYSEDGFPFCPWGMPMKPRGIEYEHRRTKYACFKACKKEEQPILFPCNYDKEQYKYGYTCYTYFSSGYRKFGPALPHNAIYQKLKPLRTGIERTFGLVKENRYRMEETNFYRGLDNVTIHAVEHDIVLTQDIIFDYLTTGKKSPVLKLNY
jgi:hypothetical protein